jgi:hypothetical protein
MRRFAFLSLLLLASVTSAFARGLDDVGEGLLSEPAVLAAIRVTPEQRATMMARLSAEVIKAAFKAVRAAGQDEVTSLKLEFSLPSSLKPSDLTASQRRRMRQIALQREVLNCLMTSDLETTLDLTPSQIARLKTIDGDRSSAFQRSSAAIKRATALKAKYAAYSKKLEQKPDEMNDAQFAEVLKMVDALAADFAMLTTLAAEETRPINLKANERALRVLTPRQLARLRQLQGAKFSG